VELTGQVFYTSDLHIGHRNVQEMRSPYMETSGGWHDEVLADNWDTVVNKDDVVYVLGDLCLQGTRVTENALAWIKERPGRKHLIFGNHDVGHPGINRQFAKWMPKYLNAFETAQSFIRKGIAHHRVLMSHFPYAGDHTATDRYGQWRLPDLGEWLLHGHVHSQEKIRGKMIHVGVDAWEFAPVPQDEIVKLMNG
jgi:calcineurin-like phosphoesterase family protein